MKISLVIPRKFSFLHKVSGFTLIELLVVIAVLGVLAVSVLVVVNPLAQIQKTRDARRKSDIAQISAAIMEYIIIHNGEYPPDGSIGGNDTSVGLPASPSKTDWDKTDPFALYASLVGRGILKTLPKDPINDANKGYYYIYEPNTSIAPKSYWIGAKLEHPVDAGKPYFRCSDKPVNPGCIESTNDPDSG